MTPGRVFLDCVDPKDEGSKLFQDCGNCLPIYEALCFRILPEHLWKGLKSCVDSFCCCYIQQIEWCCLRLLEEQFQLHKHSINLLKLLVTRCTNSLTFNNCTFCPHCIYVFCIYMRTNSDLCHLQHKLIGFYNRDEKCLLCGTNWVFK